MKRYWHDIWLMPALLVFSVGAMAEDTTAGASTADPAHTAAAAPLKLESLPPSSHRNGREIYENFRAGLADPECDAAATSGR